MDATLRWVTSTAGQKTAQGAKIWPGQSSNVPILKQI